jgi:hypothetical protein
MTLLLDIGHDPQAYDAYVTTHPHAMVYYSRGYGRFLETLLGCEIEHLTVTEGGRIAGVMPLARTEGADGTVFNALPYFGSHGGPLASSHAARELLLSQLTHCTELPGTASAMVVENPFDDTFTLRCPDDCLALSDERISQMTPLSDGGEDALMAQLAGSARRNIRKAARQGVTVAVENDQFDFLRDTHIATMTAIGGQPKSSAFFNMLRDTLVADIDYTLHVARVDGVPIAALLTLYGYGIAEYFTPVTLPDQRHLEPMAAILRQAMLDAAGKGCRLWNWGGTWTSQNGVYQFKKKWGAIDGSYRYHILVRNRDLLQRQPKELMAGYPGFYTVPFDALRVHL